LEYVWTLWNKDLLTYIFYQTLIVFNDIVIFWLILSLLLKFFNIVNNKLFWSDFSDLNVQAGNRVLRMYRQVKNCSQNVIIKMAKQDADFFSV